MRHRSPSPNHAIVPGVVAITSCCHTCSKLLQSALKEKNERKHLLQSAFKEKNERKERKKGGRQLLLVTIKRKGNIVDIRVFFTSLKDYWARLIFRPD